MTSWCWRIMAGLAVCSGMALAAPAPGEPPDSAGAQVLSATASESDAAEPARDPFWPVGYSPVTKKVAVVAETVAETAPAPGPAEDDLMQKGLAMIRVGGVIRRWGKCYAAVNGVIVEAGDDIPVMLDERVMIFTVRSIDMHRIRIEPAKRQLP